MKLMTRLRFARAGAVALGLAGTSALAAGEHSGGHDDGAPGQPGQAAEVSRTVEVDMHDIYFEPESIAVEAGETIRFVVENKGELVHEFNLGTPDMHEKHLQEMQMMMDQGMLHADHVDEAAARQQGMGHGMHDHANSVLLEPGGNAELIWTFPEQANLEFACNVPGHYAAGMVGDIKLK